MKWKTQYENHGRVKSEHGSRDHKLYGATYDDAGRIRLVEKGTESIYNHIQSFAESCDIQVVLKRYANGETDLLSRVQGFYGDFRNLPGDYAELLNTVNAGQELFNSLAVDIRAKFNHSFNEFMTALCDGSFVERVAPPSPLSPTDGSPSPIEKE